MQQQPGKVPGILSLRFLVRARVKVSRRFCPRRWKRNELPADDGIGKTPAGVGYVFVRVGVSETGHTGLRRRTVEVIRAVGRTGGEVARCAGHSILVVIDEIPRDIALATTEVGSSKEGQVPFVPVQDTAG